MSDYVISIPLILVISFCLPSVCQTCIPVQQCGNGQVLSIDRLGYELNNDSWNNVDNNLCPRTDPSVRQFHIFFQDSSNNKFSSGTFCSIDTLFNSSEVCSTSTGELLIHNTASTFLNSNGIVEFGFTSINDSYNTTITIIYAVTGVFPDDNVIYFEENQSFVTLNWFIYHPPDHDDPIIKIRYNQQILTDATVKLDNSKYQSHQDSSLHCFSALSGDSTTYYSLFVISPTISSEGEYVLIIDTYSATITLELNPSPLLPSTSYASASLLISSFSEITSSIISQQDITVTTSSSFTTSLMISSHQLTSSNSFNYTSVISSIPNSSSITIILPAILVPSLLILILFIAVIIIIIPVTILCIRHKRNQCKHRKDAESLTNNDMNFVTKNPTYIQQFSQDPSLYKYHVPRDGTEVDTTITTEATPPIPPTTIVTCVDVLSPSSNSLNNNKPHPPSPPQYPQHVPKRNQLKDIPINNVSQSLPASFQINIYNEHSVSSSLMNFEKDFKKCINYGPMAKINGRKIADCNIEGEILNGIIIPNGQTNVPTDSGDNCHELPEQSLIDTRIDNTPIKQVDSYHGDDDNDLLNMSFEEGEISDMTVATAPTDIDGFNSESSTTSVEESSHYSDNNTSSTKLIPDYRT